MKKLRLSQFILMTLLWAAFPPLFAQAEEESGGGFEVETPPANVDESRAETPEPAKPTEPLAPAGAGAAEPELRRRRGPPSAYGSGDYEYNYNYFDQDQEGRSRFVDRIQWRVIFWTNGNYFNNSDLRKINEANEESVRQTDDRMYFALSGAEVNFFFPINPRLDVRMDLWRTGFWGGDQLAGRDANNDSRRTPVGANTVNFGQMYLDIHMQPESLRDSRLDLSVGRQYYSLGGEIDREYYLDDSLDAVFLKWYGQYGRLDLMLIDLFGSGADTQEVNFVQSMSYDSEKQRAFNGDSNTYRQGLTYRLPLIGDFDLGGTHLEVRGFYYYARMGGLNDGGSDRSNEGAASNDADRDFVFMRGVRLNAGYSSWVRASLSVADSFGIDRKATDQYLLPSRDVDANGRSWQLETEFVFFGRALILRPTYFFAEGGRYYLNGEQFSHGFTAFKGDQIGGLLTNLNWGLHPSGYVDDDGIDNTPFDRDRKSGAEVKHIGLKVGWPDQFYFTFDWSRISDTNQTGIFGLARRRPFAGLFSNSAPIGAVEQALLLSLGQQLFPEQAAVLAAQRRFGQTLGEEYTSGIEWNVTSGWRVWAIAGVFFPMRYYNTAGLVSDAPQGNARFTGAQIGTRIVF